MKKETKSHGGVIALSICGIITIAIIICCVFFPEQIFGMFK